MLMKVKRIVSLIVPALFCIILSSCGNNDTVKTDVEKQLESIKIGQESLMNFDMYNRMHVQDSKQNLEDIENNSLNHIFSSMGYEVSDISVNNSTAIATLNLTTKDVDKILSKDYIMTQLILDYANYMKQNPNATRTEVDSYMMDMVCKTIYEEEDSITTTVHANVYKDSNGGAWRIAYDDAFLNAILGGIDEEYLIDMDDICEEAMQEVDIMYDYNKILNLPESNKTTRSSIKSPIKINEEAIFDNSDYFFQKERYVLKMKLTDVIRGSKAKEMLDEASKENSRMLNTNEEFILFKVQINLDNNLTSSEIVSLDATDFSLMDSNGHFYNNCIVFGIDSLSPISEGNTTEGWVCFSIARGTSSYLMFKDYMDNTLVFSN